MATYARDALASNLLAGATLNAAGTTQGNVAELCWPGACLVELLTGTVTGTLPTIDIEIQGSEDPAFATLVSYGRLGAIDDDDNGTYQMPLDLQSRYVRANVVVGGTSPVYTGSTAYVRLPHDRQVIGTSTASD